MTPSDDRHNMPDKEGPINTGKNIPGFVDDVMKLASGTAIAQAINIAAMPLLARLYAPDAWGVLSLYIAITTITSIIACMRYELAIVLPSKDSEAANIFGASLLFAGLTTALSVLLVFYCREPVVSLLNAPALAPYMWLIPVMVLIKGVFMSLNYWNMRTRKFGRLAIAQVKESVSTTGVKLGAGYAGYATASTLIFASVAGQGIAASILGRQLWREDRNLFIQSISWKKMYEGVKGYKKFPLYSLWAGLLNTASWQLPAFLLSAFFSTKEVGFYTLGFRILQLPMNLIGIAIGQVFFQRAAAAKAEGNLADLLENGFRGLVIISLFPMLMLTIIGRDLYVVLFGAIWSEAGVYTQILSIWAFVWFISSPISTVFGVLDIQEQDLKIQSLIFISRIGALTLGGWFGDARLCILFFSLAGIITYGYFIYEVFRHVGVLRINAMRHLKDAFIKATPFIGVSIIAKIFIENPIYIVLIGTFVFFGYVFSQRRVYMSMIKQG